ncbi:hypothetical protein GCM10010533_35600 [Mycolicibacterium pallens]
MPRTDTSIMAGSTIAVGPREAIPDPHINAPTPAIATMPNSGMNRDRPVDASGLGSASTTRSSVGNSGANRAGRFMHGR